MSSCCFAGPYKLELSEKEKKFLGKVILHMIDKENIREFYICNLGVFNKYVMGILFELKKKYTDIVLQIVVLYIDEEIKNVLNGRGELTRIVSVGVDEELPYKLRVKKQRIMWLKTQNF